ncbi:hypothetical protein IE81DRAFT_324849 [Ceraceosorus guamensis]|uniref:UDP-glucose:glycoprotein glucosyltransferase n=1 Tax=Ceraceosorus guamensis TaxID=1522189 RepID=A0A316VU59_9BASI|nr:hypothetical protein IE81DRAFT_324849 [Ceraceosorus guamensis]PWN41129.1 hypothetical protein IE81DRAFT_324849 [Ceraceosorus guamensis]
MRVLGRTTSRNSNKFNALIAFATSCLACISLVAPLSSAAQSHSPPISVSLQSPWPATPLLLEILEAAHTQDPGSFWPLLDRLTDPQSVVLDRNASDERTYTAAVQALDDAGLLEKLWDRQLWNWALAMHTEAPKVTAFWQMYNRGGAEERWSERSQGPAVECGSWVAWGQKVLCTASEVEEALGTGSESDTTLLEVPFDHIRHSKQGAPASSGLAKPRVAILYADPYSPNFRSLHQELSRHVSAGQSPTLRYVLRWKAPRAEEAAISPAFLAGYGATLDLKKVDYLVIDDRRIKEIALSDTVQGKSLGSAQSEGDLIEREWLDKLIGTTDEDKVESLGNLNEGEITELGAKATQLIIQSPDPLRALAQLSHDFPVHAVGLARRAAGPKQEFLEELEEMHTTAMEAGSSDIWLNGKALAEKEISPLGLLAPLRADQAHITSLTSPYLNLTPAAALDLLTYAPIGQAQDPDASSNVFFDASDRIERGMPRGAAASMPRAAPKDAESSAEGSRDLNFPREGAITYLNDLEKDSMYASWSPSLQALIRPLWPGAFPHIARNIFNVILVMDLTRRETCGFLAESLFPTIPRIGLRWGFVPGGLEDLDQFQSLQMARLFWLLHAELGNTGVVEWLKALVRSTSSGQQIDVKLALNEARRVLKSKADTLNPEQLLTDPELSEREHSVRSYVKRLHLDLRGSHARGHVLVNGQRIPFNAQAFNAIHSLVSTQTQALARPVYFRQIDPEQDISHYFYDLPTTFTSRSSLVFPDEEISTPDNPAPAAVKPRAVDLVKAADTLKNKAVVERFVYSPAFEKVNATVWVVGDLDSQEGSSLVREALNALSQNAFRLGFVHVPRRASEASRLQPSASLLSTFLHDMLSIPTDLKSKLGPENLIELVEGYQGSLRDIVTEGRVEGQQIFGHADPQDDVSATKEKGWNTPAATAAGLFWDEVAPFANALGIDERQFGIVLNGRVLTGFNAQNIDSGDFEALLSLESRRRIDPVVEGLSQAGVHFEGLNKEDHAQIATFATSIMSSVYYVDEAAEGIFQPPQTARSSIFDQIEARHSSFEKGDRSTAHTRLFVALDPLSERTQSWIPVLKLIASMKDTYLRVILNPETKQSELPLKRFYRSSAPTQMSFDASGKQQGSKLQFLGMPEDAVLTMALDTPPSWLPMAAEAVYDLDNIRLRDVPPSGRDAGVNAIYELKHILLEGHAREEGVPGARQIPRGLELVLESPDGAVQLDTIVMANLAYFQFRAQPGLYRLRIREGRSSELFEMRSVGNHGWESPSVDQTGDAVTVDTLHGLTIYPRVKRRPGKQEESLVVDLDEDMPSEEEDSAGKGLLAAARQAFKAAKGKADEVVNKAVRPVSKRSSADINIFTVASGHLYERMTYIMILSVLKHTKSSVKFWFIENFLSPSFKEFIPHLAQEYGFDYELITYAWPHWLRGQREKQRIIWGMKILFLDVLFPLDLSKIIFVDADQIVRSDLQELVKTDLHGAPYGYPPMGNDSYDMDNFRFWEQGYWKNFLRGKPYHISALYVVDLNRFRRVAAGDRLRGHYQQLSADPNSLANLDQDLPNSLQFQLPIFTLDKTWLWCETWCSKDWLAQAKTIDLCQNPKIKSTKLERARQIPEWTAYDEEVARLASRLAGQDKLGKNVVVDKQETVKEKEVELETSANLAHEAVHHDEL